MVCLYNFLYNLSILGVTEILCSFRLVLEGKTGIEITKLSRLEFLEKFLASNFTSSETEGCSNTQTTFTQEWLYRWLVATIYRPPSRKSDYIDR